MVNGRFPFGDAHIIGTPYIDRLSQQMFVEQRNRDIMRRQRQQAMDDEFAKNVANVRDADVDDITNSYGEWKLMNQQLMKQKGGITPQDQMELLRKKATIFKKATESKAEKEREALEFKNIMDKPLEYNDDAYDMMIRKRRMPISSGFQEVIKNQDGTETVLNLADPNIRRYKGTDFDFQKAQKEAEGQLKDILGTEALTPDGFAFNTPVTQFGNTPAQYKESLLGSLGLRKAGDAASRLWYQMPQKAIDEVNRLYSEIPKEKLAKMGIDKIQDIEPKNPENAAEQYATHMAKLYAINSEPKEGKPVTRRNEKAYLDAQLAKDKEMANLRHGLAVALKRTPGAKAEGSEDDSLYIEDYWDGAVDKALSDPENERKSNVLRGGEYQMEIDPVIAKAFIRQGLEPEEMTVTKDGIVTPKYYSVIDDGKGGTKKVLVQELSKPMSRTQALLTMGVKATTGKQRYKEGKSAVDNNKDNKPKTYQGLDKNGNPIFK